jgi:Ca-activated chloride channel homolog
MIKGFSTILRPVPVLLFALSVASAFAQAAPASQAPASGNQARPAGPNPAQTPPAATPEQAQQSGDQQYTITRQVNEVDLVFAVTDRRGRFIQDLKQSDFALLDDQKAPSRPTCPCASAL